VVIVAYGCVARSARRAVLEARSEGLKVGMLKLITLWPFPRSFVELLVKAGKTLLVPEMNMGQISREVKRVNEGMSQVLTLNKIDGTIISPKEILAKLKEKR
jgi:2-oxoglutarate ferredoxin oxidoreductase subunit alpha